MIPSQIIHFYVFLNLLCYITITLPLDIITYRTSESSRVQGKKPDHPLNLWSVVTFVLSCIIWILFIVVPLEGLIGQPIIYLPSFQTELLPLAIIQLIGGLSIGSGTLIAIFGRIARWNRAFSWGVPQKLETHGMYNWIRHPLYASYIFYFIGFPLLLMNVLLTPLLLGVLGYYHLSIYEEKILIKHFPDQYPKYQKTTKRFIPFLW